MWLEKVETFARNNAYYDSNAADAAAEAKHARILLCDFALLGEIWTETLTDTAMLWHRISQDVFLGDIFTCYGFGENARTVLDVSRAFMPTSYSSHDEKLSAEEQAQLLNPLSKEQLKLLERYDTIEIVAHGLGVRLAALLLNSFPESWFVSKHIRGIALGGTVTAVDDQRGMSSRLWNTMLDKISVATMEQHYLNFFNTNDCYYNLRGEPVKSNGAIRSQKKLQNQTKFHDRLLKCAHDHMGESNYVKIAVDLCSNSADNTIFRSLYKARYRGSYNSDFNLFLLILSAELCFAPQAPLGKLGRTRFDRYMKLHYAYRGDVLCPAEAVQADLEMTGGASAQVRTLDGPHLNCEQICQLLLSPAHPDWAEVEQLVAQSQ